MRPRLHGAPYIARIFRQRIISRRALALDVHIEALVTHEVVAARTLDAV